MLRISHPVPWIIHRLPAGCTAPSGNGPTTWSEYWWCMPIEGIGRGIQEAHPLVVLIDRMPSKGTSIKASINSLEEPV